MSYGRRLPRTVKYWDNGWLFEIINLDAVSIDKTLE